MSLSRSLRLIGSAIVALWASSISAAGSASHPYLTWDVCQLAFRKVHFTDVSKDAPYIELTCQSRLRIESTYLCFKTFDDIQDLAGAAAGLNETCQKFLDVSLPPISIIDHYTDDDVKNLHSLEIDEREAGISLSEVATVTDEVHRVAYETLDTWDYVYAYHYTYGYAVCIFWVVVVLISMSSRLMSVVQTRYLGQVRRDSADVSYLAAWLRRHITIPATFGYRASQNIGWCTIPPRVQSLTILVFVLLNIGFCIHGYRFQSQNFYFPTFGEQFWRYVSDRTGIVSFANFPITWLFGMRNNVLMWLTGWDFGTYNNFHRWIARVATLQAVVHSIGYTILICSRGGFSNFMTFFIQTFFWAGELATISMCAILIASVFWVRRKHYETFLILHIVMSVVVLVTMVLHVSIFTERYSLLAWIPALIWGLDRVVRMSRTVSFNLRFWNTWASATYDPSTNMVRLEIPHSTSLYQPRPGTFYYLHFLDDCRFWESHPFTMAYTSSNPLRSSKDSTEDTPLLLQETNGIRLAENAPDNSGVPVMTFLIRPYDSSTSRLRDVAAAHWPTEASLRVLVEGPYGHTQPFEEFEHLIFVVGGSGIVVPLAYLSALLPSSRTKSIRIVWAVRERCLADEVLNKDFGKHLDHEKLSVKVCVTHHDEPEDLANPRLPETVDVKTGRPDARSEVQNAAKAAGTESLAVVACGPPRMADDARRASVEMLGYGHPRIEYFEESFQW